MQHYLTMLGSTVLIPFLIVPPMGGDISSRSVIDRTWSVKISKSMKNPMDDSNGLQRVFEYTAEKRWLATHAKPSEERQCLPAGTPEDLAAVIGTIFFISGWITLMQTIAGDRLPIIQVALLWMHQ